MIKFRGEGCFEVNSRPVLRELGKNTTRDRFEMREILEVIGIALGVATQLAAILLPIVFYLLTYRHDDKRTRLFRRLRFSAFTILIFLSVGNLFKLAADQYSIWTNAHKCPIEVSPDRISAVNSPFQYTRTVSVINRADSPYHQVWIRIVLSEVSTHWNDIEIKPRFPLQNRPILPDSDGFAYISSDVWSFGLRDARDRELSCILIRSIPPRTTLEFDMRLPPITGISGGDLLLDVWSFSSQPTAFIERRINGESESGIVFQMPETVTMLGSSVILSKEEK